MRDFVHEIDGFTKRYIHAHDKQSMRQLARDWLAWLGWEFRANANVDTLLTMLMDESLRRTRTLYVMVECDNRDQLVAEAGLGVPNIAKLLKG